MQVIEKPVEMICLFDEKGMPHPMRFRLQTEDGSEEVIKVNKVFFAEKDTVKYSENLIFRCESLFNGIKRVYELKFNLPTCKWIIYRM